MRFLTILLLPLLVGCGFPRFLPGQVKGIRVVDLATGHDIPSATVSFKAVPVTYWMRDSSMIVSETADESPADFQSGDALEVTRTKEGIFHPNFAIRLVVWTPTFAIGLPTPVCHDYQVYILAAAPGYRAVLLKYYAEDSLTNEKLSFINVPESPDALPPVILGPEGQVSFRLRRQVPSNGRR